VLNQAPLILNLASKWSLMLRPILYTWGKSPRYPWDTGIDGPQNLSLRGGEGKNS